MTDDSAGESAKVELAQFVNYLSLTYHEGRNVRHLIKGGYVEPARFQKLQSLPTNKVAAWDELQPLRISSCSAGSATAAAAVFDRRFGLSIGDLGHLFQNPHWRNSAHGGNAWGGIGARVERLRDAIDSGDRVAVDELLKQLPAMRHNTGRVGDKLRSLSI